MTHEKRSGASRSSSRKVLLPALILLLVLAVVGLFIYGINISQKELSVLFPVEETIAVSITTPRERSRFNISQEVPVHGTAVGARSITRLVLWVNGSVVGAVENPQGSPGFEARWRWKPGQPGLYRLTVRAYDREGKMGTSSAVDVIVSEPWMNEQGVYLPEQGEDLVTAAEKLGLPPGILALANPQVKVPAEPLPAGLALTVPLPPPSSSSAPEKDLPPGPPPDAAPQPAEKEVSGWKKVAQSAGLFNPGEIPGTPSFVGIESDGCDFILKFGQMSDGGRADYFFLYRRESTEVDFKRIAILEAKPRGEVVTYRDVGMFGTFDYYVSAYNQAGQTESGITSVDNTQHLEACYAKPWAKIDWSHFRLTMDDPLDLLYCYFSRDGGAWVRVPDTLSQDQFWTPDKEGRYDLSSDLPPLGIQGGGPVTLAVKCLGWQGGSLMENYLGELTITWDQAGKPLTMNGPGWSLEAEYGWKPQSSLGDPGPGSDPAAVPLANATIPAPTNLRRTLDPRACASHLKTEDREAAQALCSNAIQNGDLVMIWEWTRTSCWPKPDGSTGDCNYFNDINGFQVRVVRDGDEYLVETVSDRAVIIPAGWPPLQGSDPREYLIRAFAENTEEYGDLVSEPSNLLPVTEHRLDPFQTIVLEPVYMDTFYEQRETTGAKNCGGCVSNMPSGCAGYAEAFEAWSGQHSGRCGASSYYADIAFDLSALQGRLVHSAVLSFDLVDTYWNFPGVAINWEPSCAARIGYYINTEEWEVAVLKNLNRYVDMGPSFTAEATEAFHEYWTSSPDWGGSFRISPGPLGSNAGDGSSYWSGHKKDTFQCYSQYDNFQLEVQVFPEDW